MGRDRVIQLQERAEELGFSTITEAIDAGYHEVQDLVAGTFTLEKIDEQEQAHEAWLKERDEVLEELKKLHEYFVEDDDLHYSIVVAKAIKLLEEGEC